jgi:toxin YhaV
LPTLGRYQGWLLIAYPKFLDNFSSLSNEASKIIDSGKSGALNHPKVKLMAALDRLVFEIIPSDPAASKFLLGNTLGPKHRAWRRAKFGGQHRLFFRFDSKAKIIIFGSLNDHDSLRAYGSKTDAYAVFAKMLEAGSPPTTWTDLLGESEPQ